MAGRMLADGWRFASTFVAAVCLVLLAASPAWSKAPPTNKTYFLIFVGGAGDYQTDAECVTFKKRRACFLDSEVCGRWRRTNSGGKRSGLSFRISYIEEGVPVVLDGHARIDARGRKSSLGGTATVALGGQVGNLALVGRETSRDTCRDLRADFNRRVGSVAATTPVLQAKKAPPPAGRSYFTVFVGLEGEDPHFPIADCLRFTRSGVCNPREFCGPWEATEVDNGDTVEFSFVIEDEHHGEPFVLEAQSRLEATGAGESLGGAGRFGLVGQPALNFGIGARQVKHRKCPLVLEQFIHTAQAQEACLAEAQFGDPEDSLYILPYPAGDAWVVYQTYCTGLSHWFGYDFRMPVGSPLVAAREGVVRETRNDLPDNAQMPDPSQDGSGNFVMIEHDDGSFARYAHMQQGSVAVSVGQQVEAGQSIGRSGHSGNSDSPHLHFDITNAQGSLPVNFRNAQGRLDPRGGLLQAERYEAR